MASTPQAGRYDLDIRRGKTYRRAFRWAIDSVNVDLSDATPRLVIRHWNDAPTTKLELTLGNGIEVEPIDEDDGGGTRVTFTMTAEQTAVDLSGEWDISFEFPNDDDIELLRGYVTWGETASR